VRCGLGMINSNSSSYYFLCRFVDKSVKEGCSFVDYCLLINGFNL